MGHHNSLSTFQQFTALKCLTCRNQYIGGSFYLKNIFYTYIYIKYSIGQ